MRGDVSTNEANLPTKPAEASSCAPVGIDLYFSLACVSCLLSSINKHTFRTGSTLFAAFISGILFGPALHQNVNLSRSVNHKQI
jgi:hypothetical protein